MPKLIDIPEGTDVVEVRKKMNKLFSTARNSAKPDKCILCGKPQTSFCNSHSVPQLSLRNIADNGKVLHVSLLMGIDVVDIEKGVNNSGTFHFICNECDGTFFQDYEDEQNLKSIPTDKMLAEIAVKNILLQLSKRGQEKELYRELQKQFHAYSNLENLERIKELDVRDYKRNYSSIRILPITIFQEDTKYYIGQCCLIKFRLQHRVLLPCQKIWKEMKLIIFLICPNQ